MSNTGVYGSGLNSQDWVILRDVIWPFLHAKEPWAVEISPSLPDRLKTHPMVSLLREYQSKGSEELLDQAGKLLIPSDKPFGWYAPLTK